MTKTVWKSYNGIDVSIEDNGDFCAKVAGVFLRDGSWERLRLRIERESKAEAQANYLDLECVAMISDDDGDYGVELVTLIGLNRNDSSFKFEEKIERRNIQVVLPRTDENVKLLGELAVAKSTVRDIETTIKTRTVHQIRWAGRIDATKYNGELKNLKERYERALKGKA